MFGLVTSGGNSVKGGNASQLGLVMRAECSENETCISCEVVLLIYISCSGIIFELKYSNNFSLRDQTALFWKSQSTRRQTSVILTHVVILSRLGIRI
jgi:hypothetical protein